MMAKRYFDLSDDVHIAGRWYLGTPTDAAGQEHGSWLFTRGGLAQVKGPLRVSLYRPGKALDFSLADAGAIPIVHARVASLLREFAPEDVQLFPIEVEDQPDPFFLVNVTRLVKCIDDRASEEVEYWMPEDGRPEKTGKYRAVAGMRIDPSKVGDAKVFRTWGWTIALIVSEEIKEALERIGATGTKFKQV
ncbi:imm11 family protein [Stigmatella hybrida]|uniref:imm11 family protein n=1 Tax=Stigmatella hybrida TaxID=394097 RepID=UPI0037DA0F2E